MMMEDISSRMVRNILSEKMTSSWDLKFSVMRKAVWHGRENWPLGWNTEWSRFYCLNHFWSLCFAFHPHKPDFLSRPWLSFAWIMQTSLKWHLCFWISPHLIHPPHCSQNYSFGTDWIMSLPCSKLQEHTFVLGTKAKFHSGFLRLCRTLCQYFSLT